MAVTLNAPNNLTQEISVEVVARRIKVWELVSALGIDANCFMSLQLLGDAREIIGIEVVDAVPLEERNECELLRPEARFDDELELSIHLDQLDQVNFVLEEIVTTAEVIVPLLRVLVPGPLFETAAEVVNESSFEDLCKVVVVRFAVPDDFFDLVFIVRLFLVQAVFLVLGVHALHEMTLVAEGLVSSDYPRDDSPYETCITTYVGEDLVNCQHRPFFFHLLGALQKQNAVEPDYLFKRGTNCREST